MQAANADTIVLEPARPVEPEHVAELMIATDPHIFGALHGHDHALAVRHLAHQWQQPRGVFSHTHCIAAMHDGALAGISLGFDRATQEADTGPFLEQAGGVLTPAQIETLIGFLEYGSYALPPVPEDAWYLQNLATTEAARGRGIGDRLLQDCFERARNAGLTRVHLDVYEGNPAIRLYERAGMKTIVETRVLPLEAEGFPLHLRMEIRL
jgi:ribosomal protein S18 acetylase RimI-like enzyme